MAIALLLSVAFSAGAMIVFHSFSVTLVTSIEYYIALRKHVLYVYIAVSGVV